MRRKGPAVCLLLLIGFPALLLPEYQISLGAWFGSETVLLGTVNADLEQCHLVCLYIVILLRTSPHMVSGRNVQTWRPLAPAHAHCVIFGSAQCLFWIQLKVWPVTDNTAAAGHWFAGDINSFVFCFAKDLVFGWHLCTLVHLLF